MEKNSNGFYILSEHTTKCLGLVLKLMWELKDYSMFKLKIYKRNKSDWYGC